ncbi:type VI secretion protein [Vibrio harveyi]|uniref:type VI secretion system lipoprotein TssJ n=1 Tax=Vibrio harveyi group TaxID=717610 RepID=UPI00069DFB34|nr:type VI secretion system lipoprotein TssJ [Vibrio harveyi]CAH1534179.1 Type VI secretion lipoprotein/VasD [Vibrio jasicida]EKO3836923.1 type VI secretion system lipoprotein TssJ [Vibrio harveyi]EKO3843321.1 type VI secretion system lipoprotein TssJ [Vibrio harveyi]KNY41049.1 type VI secretion protein [Vibrio harveyi]MCG9609398.1 type VI secretion system lipoprotein TssJ [Vibrio harveyi]
MKIWLSLLAFALVGCSSDPTPVVTQYQLAVSAEKTINPSVNNSTNPVVVRLYQLTDAQQFKQLPFIDLYNDDVSLLGANLVSKQVLPVVMPDSNIKQTLDINKTTQYIGVLVEFAEYDASTATVVTTTPQEEEQYIQLKISGNKAALQTVTPDSPWWDVF